MKQTLCFLITFLCSLFLSQPPLLASQFQTSSQTGNKLALLIGIRDYSAIDFHSLDGSLSDISIVRETLITHFHFQPEDITLLKDQEATHIRIHSVFFDLAERIKPGDFVAIHYSGRGFLAKDHNGDEQSGWDQTRVSFGACSNMGGFRKRISSISLTTNLTTGWPLSMSKPCR